MALCLLPPLLHTNASTLLEIVDGVTVYTFLDEESPRCFEVTCASMRIWLLLASSKTHRDPENFMNLIIWMFHRSDLSRSRAMVAEVCEKRIEARRKFDKAERDAARALADAQRLEEDDFRMKFEKRVTPRSAFLPSLVPAGAKPTPFDAWEFARVFAAQRRHKAAVKPSQPYPIRSLYIERSAA